MNVSTLRQIIFTIKIRSNPPKMPCLCFRAQLVSLFKSYFEGELCEMSIKNNFVLMYELLDEAMDYGMPQLTDPTVLKSLIFQKGFRSEFSFLLEVRLVACMLRPPCSMGGGQGLLF